jgi:hypothetical protein
VAKPKAEDDREKRIPEDRIEALKRHADELCGGQMEVGSLDDYPAETEEAFWKHVVDYFPSDPIPMHEDPPYDRDRLLPKPDYGPPTGREPN